MKKFILVLLTVVVATALTSKVSAQYSIPSYDVPVIADPTTFEEASVSNMTMSIEPFKNPKTREKRKVLVEAIDKDVSKGAWVSIRIYSLDNTIIYGPYLVNEGIVFEMELDADYKWGVKAIDASDNCKMSVWFE